MALKNYKSIEHARLDEAFFLNGIESANTDYKIFTGDVDLRAKKEIKSSYGFIEGSGGWHKQTSKTNHSTEQMRAIDFGATSEPYEKELVIPKSDLKLDKFGAWTREASVMGLGYGELVRELIFSHLANGKTRLCYDGGYFFAATHLGSQDNQIASGDYGASVAEIKAGYQKARALLRSFYRASYNDQGTIRYSRYNSNLSYLVDICNPNQEVLHREAFNLKTVATGGDNVMQVMGEVKQVISHPDIADFDWILLRVNSPIKPIYLQNTYGPDSAFDDSDTKIANWLMDAMIAVFFGSWMDAIYVNDNT